MCVHIGLFSRREDKDSIDFVVVHNNCVCVMHWLYAFLQLGKSISVILTSHIVTVYVYPCVYLRALNLPKQEDSKAQQNKKQSTKFCVQGHNRGRTPRRTPGG